MNISIQGLNGSGRHFFCLNHAYLFSFFTIIITGIFAPRLLAYSPTIIGVLFAFYFFMKDKKFILIDKPLLLFFCALVVWMGISSAWSINPAFSFDRATKITLIIAAAFLFFSISKKIILPPTTQFPKYLIIGFAIMTLLLAIEKMSGHFLTETILGYNVAGHKSNRCFVVLSLFSFPVLYVLSKTDWRHKKLLTLGLILLIGSALTQTESQTAQLCFIVGIIFIYVIPAKKIFVKLFFGGLIILTFALPLLIKPVKNMMVEDVMNKGIFREASIIHRFEIWEFSVDKMLEKPLLGHGVDSLRFLTADKWMVYQKSDQALHSHNIILQFWVEFGVIGAAFLVLFFILCGKKILAIPDNNKRKFCLCIYATASCCVLTGYGFWQSWQLGLLFFLAAFTVFISNQNYNVLGSKNQ